MTSIFVDADACPVKDEVYRVAGRHRIPVTLVANQPMRIPLNELIKIVVVTGNFDAADDWIVEQAQAGDIVVTADILLADRCLKNGSRVLGPKGEEFTEDNIGGAVATRELMKNLQDMGERQRGPSPMDARARSRFLAKLEEILQSLKRRGS